MKIFYWYFLTVTLFLGCLIGYFFSFRIKKAPSIIKIYGLFTLIFSLLVIGSYLYIYRFSSPSTLSNNINLVGQISGLIFAIFIGGIAFLQFVEFLNEKKEKELSLKKQELNSTKQAISAIKHQLADASWWTNLINEGYKPEGKEIWKTGNFRIRINVLQLVNPIEYSFIQNANLLPGLDYLGPSINSLLSGYAQWCKTFNNYLVHIQEFISSHATINIYDKTPNMNLSTEQLFQLLNDEEKIFTNKLYSMYETLHFEIIGCDTTQHLYHYHKRLTETLKLLEDDIQEKLAGLEK